MHYSCGFRNDCSETCSASQKRDGPDSHPVRGQPDVFQRVTLRARSAPSHLGGTGLPGFPWPVTLHKARCFFAQRLHQGSPWLVEVIQHGQATKPPHAQRDHLLLQPRFHFCWGAGTEDERLLGTVLYNFLMFTHGSANTQKGLGRISMGTVPGTASHHLGQRNLRNQKYSHARRNRTEGASCSKHES